MMLRLVLVAFAGVLIMDVALEVWRMIEGVERRRQLERDRAEMLRALRRTGTPRVVEPRRYGKTYER
jgi:hypothetical protein